MATKRKSSAVEKLLLAICILSTAVCLFVGIGLDSELAYYSGLGVSIISLVSFGTIDPKTSDK